MVLPFATKRFSAAMQKPIKMRRKPYKIVVMQQTQTMQRI